MPLLKLVETWTGAFELAAVCALLLEYYGDIRVRIALHYVWQYAEIKGERKKRNLSLQVAHDPTCITHDLPGGG